jgi:hypothetical protein
MPQEGCYYIRCISLRTLTGEYEMPRYRLYGSETVIQDVVYEVEAENEEEARQMVIDGEIDEMHVESQWPEDDIDIHTIKEID